MYTPGKYSIYSALLDLFTDLSLALVGLDNRQQGKDSIYVYNSSIYTRYNTPTILVYVVSNC